jgi:hypothetical protein
MYEVESLLEKLMIATFPSFHGLPNILTLFSHSTSRLVSLGSTLMLSLCLGIRYKYVFHSNAGRKNGYPDNMKCNNC